MTGQRRTGRAWCVLLPLVALLAACAGPGLDDPAAGEIRALLDSRATALADRDRDAYLSVVDPAAPGLRAQERAEFERLDGVPIGSWSYRLTDLERDGGRATVRADLGYRIEGHDRAPVRAPRTLELTRRDGRWYVSSESGPEQLWEQGDVTVVRGAHSTVLGSGQPRAVLGAIAATADEAVPAVGRSWPESWPERVVVLVPSSLDGMAQLLGGQADGFRGIAAVTTGETGGKPAPADRIVVNPDAYAALGSFGKRVVLTHEAVHVATRAATTSRTPLWLSEGFADWVGYLGSGRTPRQIAPELSGDAAESRLPHRLPADDGFRFQGSSDELARAYEGGWLAVRMIAGRWGEEKLLAFYRAAGEVGPEEALQSELGLDVEEFTARWREYVRDQLS
ncbi:hypothetical protein [Streptomyces sp. NPDC060194]|uniref:hypothetical protein n=1 Tax=Streptomyces sp. NPDC060194 TaxID=3347069 RepID=UPI0036512957